MDVRTQFFLSMVGLGIIVIFLSVLVYLSATTDPLPNNETESLFRPVAIDSSNTLGVNTLFPGRSADNENTLEESEEDIIATVTLQDTKTPGTELNENEEKNLKDNEIEYTVRMSVSWSKLLFPDWYPAGAHLSPMVVWSHRLEDAVFKPGEIASDGMERMAEVGATAELKKEIEYLGNAGYLLHYATGRRIDAPGEDSVNVILSANTPLVSAVSMVAPSPDWFVAARNVRLFQNGQWIDRLSVPATLYDAGTDSGDTFTARNDDTNPPNSITALPSAPTVPIVTFEFIRVN